MVLVQNNTVVSFQYNSWAPILLVHNRLWCKWYFNYTKLIQWWNKWERRERDRAPIFTGSVTTVLLSVSVVWQQCVGFPTSSHRSIFQACSNYTSSIISASNLLNQTVHLTKWTSQQLSVQQGNNLIPVTKRTNSSI